MSELRVTDNAPRRRFELHRGGVVVGRIDYRLEDGAVVLAHVFVEPALRGRGFASRLVADAVDQIEARGLRAKPECPFAEWYLEQR